MVLPYMYITHLECFIRMRMSTLVKLSYFLLLKGFPTTPPPPTPDSLGMHMASVFYLNSTLFWFSYNRQITWVCDVGAEVSLKARRLDHRT